MKNSNQTNAEKTMDNFREYLNSAHHNIVGENLDCSSAKGFICESITKSKRFILKIRVDESIGYAILEAYSGITVPKPFRTMAAEYCMRESDKRKVSSLKIDSQGSVYCHCETSFKDGPVSGSTLKSMEGVAFGSLLSCYDDLQQIARGVLLDKENEEDPLDLLSRLRRDMGMDDDDDSDDHSDISDIDIGEMLKRLGSDDDDDDEEEDDDKEIA
ncbi:MAG: hypothetical protein ACI4IK_02605 [Eubacterium sp.]